MGLLDLFQDDHSSVHHSGSLTHDALAGAVAYEVTKAWEDHCARNGKPDNHAKAKEVLAALTAAAASRLVETKGRDAYDRWQDSRAQAKFSEHIDVIVNDQY